jgi:hypothetical protein
MGPPQTSSATSATTPEVIFYPTYGYRDGTDWVIPLRAKAQVAVGSPLLAPTLKSRLADFFARDAAGQELRQRFDHDPDRMEYRIAIGAGTFPARDVSGIVEGTIRMSDAVSRPPLPAQRTANIPRCNRRSVTPGRSCPT